MSIIGMENKILVGKLLLVLVASLMCFLGTRVGVQQMPHRRYLTCASSYLVTSRLIVFLGIYRVLHEHAQSDVAGYYYPQANDVIHGLLPYKDFQTSYAPLFPYVASIPVRIAHSPIALVAGAIAFEFAAFPLWVMLAQRIVSPRAARLAVLLYVTSPIALVNIAIDGQNQVWISFFLAAALLLAAQRRSVFAGLALAGSATVVKFLPIAVAPAFVIRPSHRWKFMAGFVALLAIVYGIFLLLGADVLLPLKGESADHTSGNLPFLLGILLQHPNSGFAPRFFNTATAACMLAVYWLAWRMTRRNNEQYYETLLVVLFLLTLMLVSKKSYTNYLVMALFPICLVVAMGGMSAVRLALFNLFGLLAVLEPSLWFRWLGERDLRDALSTASGTSAHAKVGVFILCDLVLVGLYAIYWWQTWCVLRTSPAPAENPAVREERAQLVPVRREDDLNTAAP